MANIKAFGYNLIVHLSLSLSFILKDYNTYLVRKKEKVAV